MAGFEVLGRRGDAGDGDDVEGVHPAGDGAGVLQVALLEDDDLLEGLDLLSPDGRHGADRAAADDQDIGVNLELYSQTTVVVRKDTPADRLKVLHDAFKQAMETKTFQDNLKALSAEPSYMSGEDLDKLFPTLVEQSRAELKATGVIK